MKHVNGWCFRINYLKNRFLKATVTAYIVMFADVLAIASRYLVNSLMPLLREL